MKSDKKENFKKLQELVIDKTFINPKTKTPLTAHQIKVYAMCSQIPEGYFSTYGEIAKAINSSPRAVGQALKNNPFAPFPVPCHRVIASSGFIGGFSGQWGKGKLIDNKKQLLLSEDVLPNWNKDSKISSEILKQKLFKQFVLN